MSSSNTSKQQQSKEQQSKETVDGNVVAKAPPSLTQAITKGDLDTVIKMIEAGVDVNKEDKYGNTPLYVACQYNEPEIVRQLVAAPGIDVNKRTVEGESPLFLACMQNNIEIVEILLRAGGSITTPATSNGQTIFTLAQRKAFSPEVVNLIIPDVSKQVIAEESWKGWTQSDAAKYDSIFDTTAPEGKHPPAENVSMCPICLAYAERTKGCKYMSHNCLLDNGTPNMKLYTMYKDYNGSIYWCTICGRICDNHKHYKLSKHDEKASLVSEKSDPYSNDCKAEGGGGIEEKLMRIRRMREYALELNKEINKITKSDAMAKLVEETWDAPLAVNPIVKTIAATGKWNIPTSNFPLNVKPIVAANTVYPNIMRPNTNRGLVPTTTRSLDQFDEEQTFLQFHHRMANGEINNHEDNLISQDLLQGFIEDQNKNFGLPSFGLCWDYREGAGCTARLYPEEIKDFVPEDIYETYKKHFNKKFAVAVGGFRSTRRKQRGGARESVLQEATQIICVRPSKTRGGARTRRKSKKVRRLQRTK